MTATGVPAPSAASPTGLTSAEAAARLAAGGSNELPPPERPTLLARIARDLAEPLTLLLLAAAVVSGVALRELPDALAIVAIVVLNTVIGVAQESRAATALAALGRLAAPLARVRRDGLVVTVPAREVVEGDVVLLDAGAHVPADLRLLTATGLEMDESTLTGESLPVAKQPAAGEARDGAPAAPLADQLGRAFSGTLVVRGSGTGLVTATGPRTELGTIARHLQAPRPTTPLQDELAGLSLWLGAASVVIATLVLGLTLGRSGISGEGLSDAFLTAVALAVAAVPEGLATVTTVSLAIGVRRMAERGAIVRRLTAVETLGSTTALVIDKTGTLTRNRLHVDAIAIGARGPQPLDHAGVGPQRALLERTVLCNDAELTPPSGDTVDLALLQAAGEQLVELARGSWRRVAALPFDAERRRMTTLDERDGQLVLTVKGAPETVLDMCDAALSEASRPTMLDAGGRAAILERAAGLAATGGRILGVAHGPVTRPPDDLADVERNLVFDGLVVLRDPLRPEAPEAVAQTRSAGIRLMMATGDHPGTARAVAAAAGLATPDAAVVTGQDLRDQGLPAAPADVPIYARIEPTQKLDLVEALRRDGHVVAMTGDGVNDAPALHRADIGVALGGAGTDVAREAADLVVTDDNLATIVAAVREGRGIHDNIRRVVHYLVAGNLSEIAVVVVGLLAFAGLGPPLLPLQLLWINLITDGPPALALGLGPHDENLLQRGPRARGDRILGSRNLMRLAARGFVLASGALGVLAVSRYAGGASWAEARTAMFSTLVVTQVLYALALGLPAHHTLRAGRDRGLLLLVVGFSLALQAAVLAYPPARSLLDLVALDPTTWALAGIAGAAPPALVYAVLRRSGPEPTVPR